MQSIVPVGNWMNHVLETVRHEINLRARPLGLDCAGFSVLFYMDLHGDGQTSAELTRALLLDKASVSRTIGSLEKGDYLYRVPDDTDGRKRHLFLTEKGRSMTGKLMKIYDEVYEEFMDGLSDSEAETFIRGLDIINNNCLRIRDDETRA